MRTIRYALMAPLVAALVSVGCGGKVPPALTSASPTDAQVQSVRHQADQAIGGAEAGLAITGEVRRTLNAAPIPQAAKDAINCAIVKALGQAGPAPATVHTVCGAGVPDGPGPVPVAIGTLATVASTPNLRTTVGTILTAFDPVLSALDASGNPTLGGLAAALRAAFVYLRGLVGASA